MKKIPWKVFSSKDRNVSDRLLDYLNKEGDLIVLNKDGFYTIGENFGYVIMYIDDLQNYADRCK